MKRPKCKWPKNTTVSPWFQSRIDAAARKLAMWCLLADIDLTYVDADGLLVSVKRAPRKPKRRRS